MAVGNCRRREIVDRRDEGLFDLHQCIEQRRRQNLPRILVHAGDQIFAHQRRWHRVFVLNAFFVHAHLAQLCGIRNAVPDEIETALARSEIVVEAGDRVGDHLLLLGQVKSEQRVDAVQRLRGEVGLVRCSAPDVIAGVDRLYVRGHLRTHA